MPSYKLTYFKGKGRAEIARLLFAYSGTAYEDERLEGESWQKFKPSKYMYVRTFSVRVKETHFLFYLSYTIKHKECNS